MRAALRRRTQSERFVLGKLAIDYGQRRVTVAGRPVPLTVTEYELLRLFSLNAGRVLTYAVLLRQVWGRSNARDSDLVRTFVKRLRASWVTMRQTRHTSYSPQRRLPHAGAGGLLNLTDRTGNAKGSRPRSFQNGRLNAGCRLRLTVLPRKSRMLSRTLHDLLDTVESGSGSPP